MGTLGGEVAFFLEGLDLAGAGGGLAVGTTGLGEVSEDGLGLAMTGAGGDWAVDLARAGEVSLACSSASARRSDRDWTFRLSFFTITSFTTSTSVIVCSRSLAGEGFWGLGMGSLRRGVGGVDSQ